jgi:hypothetical protein
MAAPATAATTLVSLDALLAWMQAEDATTVQVTRLVQCVDAASALIESKTGLIFVTRAITETKDGNGRADLWLRRRPLVSVTSVTVNDAALDASQFVVDAEFGRLRRKAGAWPSGLANVTVVYQAGYGAQDAATLPQDVVGACLDLTKAVYDELTTGAIALSSVSLGPGSLVLKQNLWPNAVKRVLDVWRETRV